MLGGSGGMTAIGDAIRAARQRKGWSIARLAGKTDLDGGYISRVETGRIASPGSEQLRRIASVLDVSVDELLGLQATIKVPMVNITSAAGGGVYGETNEYVTVPANLAPGHDLVASRVVGTCMEPEIREGDAVVIDLTNRSPRTGQLVAVLMEDGNLMIKRYVQNGAEPILIDNHGDTYRPNGARIQGVIKAVVRTY
jgi:transcriptional regulator with XRE-family HTH domain